MQSTTKKVLGWIGLASVAAVTVLAYNIPNPAVATTSQTDTIKVTVHEKSSVVIQQPKAGAKITSPNIDVVTDFSDAALVEHYLTYTDPTTGTRASKLIDSYIPSVDPVGEGTVECVTSSDICTGTRVFTFALTDVDPLLTYDDYIIEAEIFDSYHQVISSTQTTQLPDNPTNISPIAATTAAATTDSNSAHLAISTTSDNTAVVLTDTTADADPDVVGDGDTSEDSTNFSYVPLVASVTGKEDNYDPIITATADTNVKYLLVQAYSPDGTPLFNGPVRIESEVVPGGTFSFSLPFTDAGAVYEMTYRIVISAYDADGTLLYGEAGAVELSYPYDNKPIPVPDTGSLLLDDLNISRSDFLITGLLIFAAVAAFSFFLIIRKKHRR